MILTIIFSPQYPHAGSPIGELGAKVRAAGARTRPAGGEVRAAAQAVREGQGGAGADVEVTGGAVK